MPTLRRRFLSRSISLTSRITGSEDPLFSSLRRLHEHGKVRLAEKIIRAGFVANKQLQLKFRDLTYQLCPRKTRDLFWAEVIKND